MREGYGLVTLGPGEVYFGEFKRDRIEGKGVHIFQGGEKFEG